MLHLKRSLSIKKEVEICLLHNATEAPEQLKSVAYQYGMDIVFLML